MPEGSRFYYLKNFPIFDGLDDETIQAIDNALAVRQHRKNDYVHLPGERGNVLNFIKEGHVKISRLTPDGREMILDIVGPGELLGELTLMDEHHEYNEVAQALDAVTICSIHRQDFEHLINTYPELNAQLARRLSLRLRKIEERMSDLLFKNVRKRIASFLVRHTEQFGTVKKQMIYLRPYLSHQDIALITGSTRQTVTTTLNEFRTAGIIDFSRKEFMINDYNRLKQLAS